MEFYKYKKIVRNRNFILFSATQFISALMNYAYLIALPIWVHMKTGSPSSSTLVSFFQVIPILLFAIPGGAIVDKLNPKGIMVLGDFIRAILVCLLFFVRSSQDIWIVYLIAIINGIITTFFQPAYNVMIKNSVEKDTLTEANSMFMLIFSVSFIIGPIIGGYMIEELGYSIVFKINSISFIIGAMGSTLLKITKNQIANANGKLGVNEGFQVIKSRKDIKNIFFAQFFSLLGIGCNSVIFTLYLSQSGFSTALIGSYIAIQGIGMVMSSIFLPNVLEKYHNVSRIANICLLFQGVFVILFITLVSKYKILSMIVILLFGFISNCFNIGNRIHLQKAIESDYIGRMFGFSRFFTQLAQSISLLVGSYLVILIGYVNVVVAGGTIIVCASLILLYTTAKQN